MSAEALPPTLAGYRPAPNEKEAMLHLFNKGTSLAPLASCGATNPTQPTPISSACSVTGDKAVPFFQHSSLPPTLLGEIWQLADPENSGFLSPDRFAIACRLIGHAQAIGADAQIDDSWVATPGPFPKFNGFPIPPNLSKPAAPATSAPPTPSRPSTSALSPLQAPNKAGGPGTSVTNDEKLRYATLFSNSGPVAGLLDGEKARDIFIKSKLPFETLGQIWHVGNSSIGNLADTHSRGALDVADFTVGMHLIQHTMNGSLPSLPAVLNPALYASAISLPVPNASMPGSPALGSRLPQSPLRKSSVPPRTVSHFAPTSPITPAHPAQIPWEITAQEKLESDGYFDGIDSTRRGAIEGEAAVNFFMQSGLPMDILARVWDLADIRQTGALNKDEFAVALKLIRDRVGGKEIPAVLPVGLTPPSLRAPTGFAASQAQPQRDLLDLLDDDASPSMPTGPPLRSTSAIVPQGTGSSFHQQQQAGQRSLSPQLTGQQQARAMSPQLTGQATPTYGLQGTIFPQATGMALSPQATGFANNFGSGQQPLRQSSLAGSSGPVVAAPTATATNFFDDNDDADTQAHLSANQTQLKSLEAEHKSAAESATNLAQSRSELEASLSATTTQINELQVKLSQARAAHETERQMVDDLVKRNEEQKAVLARARHELIAAESDLSALRMERSEIEGQLLRDKEDVRAMKKKMANVGHETATFKETLEKLKKEARQQKGLVAISRKQLSTAEGEKEKAETELKAAERSVANGESLAGVEAVEEDSPFDHSHSIVAPNVDHAAAVALPASPPAVVSPVGSVRSNNPFDRLGGISQTVTPEATGDVTAPAPHIREQQPAASSSSPGLPTAVAGAVGAGAIAAAGAVAAGAAGLFGFGKSDESEAEDKSSAHADTSAAAPIEPSETDPFGVPIERDATAADPPTSKSAFDAAFDDGFGDDFSASSAPVVASTASAPAFDDVFNSSFPTEIPATTPPAAEATVTAEAGPDAIAPVAALDRAESPSVPAEPVSAHEETPVVPSAAEELADDDNSDSSEDEPEIEDAVGTHHHSALAEDEAVVTPTSGSAQTNSVSDSGESFVHVPAAVPETEPIQSVAAPAQVDEPHVPKTEPAPVATAVDAEPLTSTTHNESISSDDDTFEEASHGDAGQTEAAAASELPRGNPASLAGPETRSEPATPVLVSTPTSATPQRRAAPPPPSRSTASFSSTAPSFGATTADAGPSTFSNADFDDAFGDSFTAAPTTTTTTTTSGTDDFDEAFSDLGPAVPVETTSAPSVPSVAAPAHGEFDFDDEAFDFKPDSPETSPSKSVAGTDPAFEDSFASFDSAFDDAPKAETTTGKALSDSPATGFDFDDTFSRGAAPAPTAATLDAAKPDDAEDVKQIVGMGFSRKQALDALEKFDHDVNRATNSLLGM
ncbi:BZ3500_MvSof-1268-A1-R1_Chr8-1g09998 [Microbotryum saponariae]|uniref:BZ3500_MvSof-1268-A1-R1_Chr8-1g09998 protein n=1 Tax=Microbotryum saponariae TaxID=289078 RepID=A0A2X0LMA2_9BASI|nr:BZ3500_MvSof-1268-A1-R1_Chr8-1g09998 [Microbotryum saponariae]SDA08284.1 BZ3501_MvSof-1269-A2-R1_Chr8-1g09721 [Microbotryum saponariae]